LEKSSEGNSITYFPQNGDARQEEAKTNDEERGLPRRKYPVADRVRDIAANHEAALRKNKAETPNNRACRPAAEGGMREKEPWEERITESRGKNRRVTQGTKLIFHLSRGLGTEAHGPRGKGTSSESFKAHTFRGRRKAKNGNMCQMFITESV